MKHAHGNERTAALAAIATARKARQPHIAIRPQRIRPTDEQSEGVALRDGHAGQALDRAVSDATAAWPDDDDWEVFGASDITDCQEQSLLGDECFLNPTPYGEFSVEDQEDDPDSIA